MTVHLLDMTGEQDCTFVEYDWRTRHLLGMTVHLLSMTGEQGCTLAEYDRTLVCRFLSARTGDNGYL